MYSTYGNWTEDGWNVRIHGNIYKTPEIPFEKLDELSRRYIISMQVLDHVTEDQYARARDIVKDIYIIPQAYKPVKVGFQNANVLNPDPGRYSVDEIMAKHNAELKYPTTPDGDFDEWLKLQNTTEGLLKPGGATQEIQILNTWVEPGGKENGSNTTVRLVPPLGLTIVSDVDDILRESRTYWAKEGLFSTFTRPYKPWMNMPEIFASWAKSLPLGTHFHYLSNVPQQLTRVYTEFLTWYYPHGSIDTRPMGFSDKTSIHRHLLHTLAQTFPTRGMILIGDSSKPDIMELYPELYKTYPDQIFCIFIRNVTATDKRDKYPSTTYYFHGIPKEHYMFFNVPDDLKGLDINNRQCLNHTIPQNVHFGYENLPKNFGKKKSACPEGINWFMEAFWWGQLCMDD